jgi:hypothetical protein
MGREFRAHAAELQWTITAYLLARAGCVHVGGRKGGRPRRAAQNLPRWPCGLRDRLEIAAQLAINVGTVKAHVSSVLAKLAPKS